MEIKAKIVDNFNLKDLEKFDFRLSNYVNTNFYKYENDYINIIVGEDRIIHFNQFTVNNTSGLSVLYDLIKANIVEVVQE